MKLYFIIATIEGREKLLTKLLDSIKSTFTINKYEIVVVRQYSAKKLSLYHQNCIVLNIKNYGASKARNIGLRKIQFKSKSKDYICFPDDDCYFDINFQEIFLRNMNKPIDLIFGDIRDPNDNFRMGAPILSKTNLKINFISINCPSFFIKYKLIKKLFFNEDYGPGAPLHAVEETEFLYRVSRNNKNIVSLYDPRLKIFHPYKLIEGKKLRDYSYAQGALFRTIFNPISIQFWAYFSVIIRPFFGYFKSILKSKQRNFYKNRSIAIAKGFLGRGK